MLPCKFFYYITFFFKFNIVYYFHNTFPLFVIIISIPRQINAATRLPNKLPNVIATSQAKPAFVVICKYTIEPFSEYVQFIEYRFPVRIIHCASPDISFVCSVNEELLIVSTKDLS